MNRRYPMKNLIAITTITLGLLLSGCAKHPGNVKMKLAADVTKEYAMSCEQLAITYKKAINNKNRLWDKQYAHVVADHIAIMIVGVPTFQTSEEELSRAMAKQQALYYVAAEKCYSKQKEK